MKKIILMLLCLCSLSWSAWAAEPADFHYKELRLGDTTEKMITSLGSKYTEIDKVIAGENLKYYIYHDTWIGIAKGDDKIVDIRIGDKTYAAKNGVKLGATPYKVLKEYGKTSREYYDNQVCYIYRNPNDGQEKLIFDITEGYLRQIRITNLTE